MSKKSECSVSSNGNGQAQTVMSYLETIADCRAVPGVLSFSASGEVLFINSEAELLNRQILQQRHGSESLASVPSNGMHAAFPAEVLEMCVELQEELRGQVTPQDCEKVELRRVTGNSQVPILLRGFLMSDPQQRHDTRLLILMEKIGRESRAIPTQVKERFRLTDREQEIVTHIADGCTNKEIAASLAISEHTVKEHVRHLLKKTKSTTRTAILAQIYQDS